MLASTSSLPSLHWRLCHPWEPTIQHQPWYYDTLISPGQGWKLQGKKEIYRQASLSEPICVTWACQAHSRHHFLTLRLENATLVAWSPSRGNMDSMEIGKWGFPPSSQLSVVFQPTTASSALHQQYTQSLKGPKNELSPQRLGITSELWIWLTDKERTQCYRCWWVSPSYPFQP